MTEQEFVDLLRVTPDPAAPAESARRGALEQIDAGLSPARSSPRWVWLTAVVAPAALWLALVPVRSPVEAPVLPSVREPVTIQPVTTQPPKTQLEMTLSDGTRVQWVFSDDFQL